MMDFINYISNKMFSRTIQPFQYRVFISFLHLLIPLACLLFFVVEFFLVPYSKASSWQQLENSTNVLTNAVESMAHVTIKDHLKSIAENNLATAESYFNLVEQGVLEKKEAVKNLREIFLNQRVGTSGYLYCINSKGVPVIHPRKGIENVDQSHFAFVRRQKSEKVGYLEYNWKNPGEVKPRKKALYMVYFKPMDWIISVSAYLEDFQELLKPEDFHRMVGSVTHGESGYSYIVSMDGDAVVHPKLKNFNVYASNDTPSDFHRTMLKEKSGRIEYAWKNPDDDNMREKIAVFRSLPLYNWIVVSTAYTDEVFEPVFYSRVLSHSSIVLLIIVSLYLSYMLSQKITRPVKKMIEQIDNNAKKSTHIPLAGGNEKELIILAQEFNKYMKRVEAKNRELLQEHSFVSSILSTSATYIIVIDEQFEIKLMNTFFANKLGNEPNYFEGKNYIDTVIPEKEQKIVYKILKNLIELAKGGKKYVRRGSNSIVTSSGKERLILWSATWIDNFHYEEGIFLLAIGQDITEERSLQEQLHHAQKLDALGRLAGGVAHDFNNMLSGIGGSAQLIERKLPSDSPLQKYTALIIKTVTKASALSSRLLAFSRKGKIASTPIDLHQIITDSLKIFSSGLDPRIETDLKLDAKNSVAVGDPSQLQNIFLNLLINARDAMPGGGNIKVATRNIFLDEATCTESAFELEEGTFIEIMFSDNGMGMDKEVVDKIFEPFFTTKEEGKGTGLGLSSAYGAVKNHRGEIRVESSPGIGTTFIIRIPASDLSIQNVSDEVDFIAGSGRILLVDDDDILRTTGSMLLQDIGYKVISAKDGLEAVNIFDKEKDTIDLVLLDMVMPRMNGRETFRKIREIDPEARIIIASGFSDKHTIHDLEKEGLMGFVSKPYLLFELSKVISDALNKDCD